MRLFVAVEIPEGVRAAVSGVVEPLRAAAPGLRWVAPERYHLTLVFLGSVEPARVEGVSAAVGQGCAGVAPFALAFDGRLGTFGRRVLWAGLEPSAALAEVASRVTAALSRVVALPDGEREFRAHLTLARAGREPVRTALIRGVDGPAVAWDVSRLVLMQSASGYSVVAAFPLVGDA